jgi:hypothetical protein
MAAYFAEALPLDLFKREQNRIAKEIDLAQAEIKRAEATDSPYGQLLETALGIIRDARAGYSAADPYVKRLWNRALMERIEIRAGQIARVELKEPFAGLFLWAGSNKGRLVGEAGHYLNRPGELRGGVLEIIRAHCDRLETSNIVDVRGVLTTLSGTFHKEPEWVPTVTTLEPSS